MLLFHFVHAAIKNNTSPTFKNVQQITGLRQISSVDPSLLTIIILISNRRTGCWN